MRKSTSARLCALFDHCVLYSRGENTSVEEVALDPRAARARSLRNPVASYNPETELLERAVRCSGFAPRATATD